MIHLMMFCTFLGILLGQFQMQIFGQNVVLNPRVFFGTVLVHATGCSTGVGNLSGCELQFPTQLGFLFGAATKHNASAPRFSLENLGGRLCGPAPHRFKHQPEVSTIKTILILQGSAVCSGKKGQMIFCLDIFRYMVLICSNSE